MVIKKLFATIAPIAPAAVEFQIHQVVPAFQMNMASKAKRKKRIRLLSLSAINNSGTQATKINGVKPASGHAHTSSKPETTLNIKGENFFKKDKWCLWGGKFAKKGIRRG